MIETPLISVITPAYNGADYLPELIESVLAQDYPHYEHIIIDDGSTDGGATIKVLSSYSHLRWWSRKNMGQYASQNEGINAAKGDIVVIIAADDVFNTPKAFQHIVDYWREHPNCDFVYGKALRMNEKSVMLPNIDITTPPSLWLLKQVVYVQHCSLFISTIFLREHNLFFNANLKYTGDWDWLIRIFCATKNIGYLKKPLAIIRMHPAQTSRTAKVSALATEHRRIAEVYGGSYTLHRFLLKCISYRAMVLIAFDTLRQRGFGAFYQRVKQWIIMRCAR